MKVKLITVAVYLGLSLLMFSCVETGDFYEKEKLELENALEDSEQSEFSDEFEEVTDQMSASDSVVVYTDVDIEASAIVVVSNNSNSDDGELDSLLDQTISDISENNEGSSRSSDSLGDDSIPTDLMGTTEGSNESQNSTQTNQSSETTMQESVDSSNDQNSNEVGGADSGDSEQQSYATEIIIDERPSQENPIQEGSTDGGEQATDNGVTEDKPSQEGSTDGGDQTADNGTGEDKPSQEGSTDGGDQTADNGTGEDKPSQEGSTDGGDQTADNGMTEDKPSQEGSTDGGDQTADNGTGEDKPSQEGSTDGGDQTADNGTVEDKPSQEGSTDGGNQTTDNGMAEDKPSQEGSTDGGDQTADNGMTEDKPSQEGSTDGGDQTADSGDQNNSGDNSGDNGSQASEEGEQGSDNGDHVADSGDGNGADSGSTGEEQQQEDKEDDNVVIVPGENDDFVNDVEEGVNKDEYICNPFEGEQQTSFQGIAGFVYDGLEHPFRKVQDYYDFGKKSETPIFMSEINVPTRRFDQGFELNNGNLVLNDMGGKLFEYFALDLRGRIRLGEIEESGHYQFALLSDDGAIFELEMDGEQKELINNDQLTPTRMKCAQTPVYFDKSTVKNFQMKYFQGPRMHIALTLMWRKVDPENIPKEKYCGQGGNGKFFDFNKVPSAPKAAYKELLARGWKPLDSQNYLLPTGVAENPCGEEQQEPEMKCFSEQVVLDGRNWFYFNGDGVNMSTVKIEDEKGSDWRYHYVERYQKIRLGGSCHRGHKFRISYCVEK